VFNVWQKNDWKHVRRRKAKSGRGARDRGAAKKALPVVEDSSDDEDGEPQPDDDMDVCGKRSCCVPDKYSAGQLPYYAQK
jgi:hypothetical protein